MKFKETNIKGNYLINLDMKEDERGFFARYFCKNEFQEKGLNTNWVQINNSYSKEKGTLRGLHYQRSPNAEVKLIRCLQGSIWDVVVDLREKSKTFGKSFKIILSKKYYQEPVSPEQVKQWVGCREHEALAQAQKNA